MFALAAASRRRSWYIGAKHIKIILRGGRMVIAASCSFDEEGI